MHLQAATRHAAIQVAELAEAHLAKAETFSPTLGASRAVATLLAAINRAEAVINAPENWGGMPTIGEALQLLGHAASQLERAQNLARQTSAGGSRLRCDSKAEQARTLKEQRPGASSQAIADAIDAAAGPAAPPTDARHVRRTLAKQRKR